MSKNDTRQHGKFCSSEELVFLQINKIAPAPWPVPKNKSFKAELRDC